MFDVLGELGSSLPWLYRGWLCLFSSNYRNSRIYEWNKHGLWYKWLDIILSSTFIISEILFLYLVWKRII